jgi:hypothetical protein
LIFQPGVGPPFISYPEQLVYLPLGLFRQL